MQNIFGLLFLVSLVCLIIGLIKPASFGKFIKGELTKKRIGKIFGISTVAFFILIGVTGETPKETVNQTAQQPVVENTQNTEVAEENKNEDFTPVVVEETQTDIIPAPTEKETETTPVAKPEPTPTPTPEPAQVEETNNTNNMEPTTPSETVSQKNAVKSAKAYLDYSAFSYGGLVDQLEYEQFSHADAVYGADNCGANWNEQASKSAEAYMEYSAFSRGGLIEQLVYEKFTQAQAEYGADSVGL